MALVNATCGHLRNAEAEFVLTLPAESFLLLLAMTVPALDAAFIRSFHEPASGGVVSGGT